MEGVDTVTGTSGADCHSHRPAHCFFLERGATQVTLPSYCWNSYSSSLRIDSWTFAESLRLTLIIVCMHSSRGNGVLTTPTKGTADMRPKIYCVL